MEMLAQRNADHSVASATADALHGIPLPCDLERSDLEEIAPLFAIHRYSRRYTIIQQDEPGTALHILFSGGVRVTQQRRNGRDPTLAILTQSEFFGEMSLFDHWPRTASVTTLTPDTASVIARHDFLALHNASSSISRHLLAEISKRLRETNDLLTLAIHHDIHERIASLLFNLVRKVGQDVPDGIKITLRLTDMEMAKMIGTTRESVNRVLNGFCDQRLIDRGIGDTIITQPNRLLSVSIGSDLCTLT
jgi:CRP/FNR family cyclic AMP-dependent transcriptional regulator